MTNQEFRENTKVMIAAKRIVKAALEEDHALEDITSLSTIAKEAMAIGRLKVKQDGATISGLPVAELVFQELSQEIKFDYKVQDNTKTLKDDILGLVIGPERLLLAGERSALNFLQHLSGIATLTNKFVETVTGTRAKILHTRKTIPGLRDLEINAVLDGGGHPHRADLRSVLIKDNHVQAAGSITKAIEAVRRHNRQDIFMVVEVETMDQFREALRLRPAVIMLDDMSLDQMRNAVDLANDQVQIEVSGGVNLQNIRAIAETGVHRISIGGALTLGAPPIDINFKTENL